MSMDSRIANKDKTILSLQLEELEPVFMGKIAKTWSFSKVFFGRVCNPLFMVLCVGVLYPYLLAFVANIYFNADTHIIVLHPYTYIYLLCIILSWFKKVDFVLHITSNCLVLITMITNLCSPGIFTVEMCAKIFAMGFICHENSYLRYCHLSMLVCSIRIVPQGKLQLVLILAIMSLGRGILYYLILNAHKPYQFQTTPNTITITRMDIGGSICHLVNLSIFMFLKQLQYFSKIPVGMFIQWDQ